MSKILLLVGAGHSHIECLREFAVAGGLPQGWDGVLLTDAPKSVYSGMVPGVVAGDYTIEQSQIDGVELARRASFRVVLGQLHRVELASNSNGPGAVFWRTIPPPTPTGSGEDGDATAGTSSNTMNDGELNRLDFDVASFNLGSTVLGLEIPGVRQWTLPTRPIAQLTERILALAPPPKRVVVVGGGTAGCELAFCLAWRWHGDGVKVTLVDSHPRLLGPNARPNVETKVRQALEQRQIALCLNRRVVQVFQTKIECQHADNAKEVGGGSSSSAKEIGGGSSSSTSSSCCTTESIEFDLCVWATGACAHPVEWFSVEPNGSRVKVPSDGRGFVLVRDTLQLLHHDNVFACGDCSTLDQHAATPKAGVYAVRQGPVVVQNLRTMMMSREPAPSPNNPTLVSYTPQSDFLSLINVGHGQAIGTKYGFVMENGLVWSLKDKIDRSFMEKYI